MNDAPPVINTMFLPKRAMCCGKDESLPGPKCISGTRANAKEKTGVMAVADESHRKSMAKRLLYRMEASSLYDTEGYGPRADDQSTDGSSLGRCEMSYQIE